MPRKKDDELTPIQRARKKYNATHAQVQFRVPEDAQEICKLYAREGETLGKTVKRIFLQRIKQLSESNTTTKLAEEAKKEEPAIVSLKQAQNALLTLETYLEQQKK